MHVWHHRHDGHEFEQALGVGDGQGSLTYSSPWECKELDATELTIYMYTLCVCVCVSMCLCVYTHTTFFIHSYIEKHLGCFHILAIENNAEVNLMEQIFFPSWCFCLLWINTQK